MSLDGKTILLVEDNILISGTYERRLIKTGARVVLASNGVEGLEKLKKERVDLIVLDLMMPKMNGYEMLKLVKEDPKLKNVPVVILTNLYDRPDEIEKIKKLGIEEYLIKSDISLAELVDKLASHLVGK